MPYQNLWVEWGGGSFLKATIRPILEKLMIANGKKYRLASISLTHKSGSAYTSPIKKQYFIKSTQIMSGFSLTQTLYKESDVSNDDKFGNEDVIYILQKVAGIR